MNENDKSRSGLQTAVDFAHAARAVKRIMQAAAASGVHGAAAATAREVFPLLLKVLIAVLVVFIVVPMVIFTALPNIFFGYNSSGTDTVIQMTQQAMTLGGVYMTLDNFEGAQIDSVVTGIAAEYEKNGTTIDHKALAKELRICEQRVTAAFKKLVELELVWEKRCGRGDANQIYLAYVTPQDDPNYTSAPFTAPEKSSGSRTSDSEPLEGAEKSAPLQDPQNLHFKNSEFCGFRTAESVAAEAQKVVPSKKEKRKIDCSQIEASPSVLEPAHDGLTDEEREDDFLNILDACELTGFTPGTALVFENAIERLYYSDSYRIGNATLPQSRVRAKLRRLDGMILREAERKLHENQEQNVKNSTAYTMAVLFNCIAESESDLMVDPYLNALSSTA